MTEHTEPPQPSSEDRITLRSPAELADALPYLLGFHPDDSIVMVALHGPHGRFGGRLRLGIPGGPDAWPEVARQLAECLVRGSAKRGSRPEGILVFLCQDPSGEEAAQEVMERLRPLAQSLRTACGELDVPVPEALCISGGRFWSYCCPDVRCCPAEGSPLTLPGTSVMAAAATFAGIQVRGSLREMEARLAPRTGPATTAQEEALDAVATELVPRILGGVARETVCEETLTLIRRLLDRFAGASPAGTHHDADLRDDALVTDEEAAAIIVGLQDRTTRDRAAEWMEAPDVDSALRLWRAVARRCVGAYRDHAAAPLTLAGWVAWSAGDEPTARVALGMALRTDPDYVFAKLLHQGANEGLDPELLRRCLRKERAARTDRRPGPSAGDAPDRAPGRGPARRDGRGSRGGTRPPAQANRSRIRRRTGRRGARSSG
ncbi:DUF4192 domain-containing protein [Streptomyces sp. NPDC001922]|uniref:DUF4192 domain-containing protein n=1 Tax=Streptomyces sp. NPDC001922 TaxID=3364624 RepID=UPI0036AE1C69